MAATDYSYIGPPIDDSHILVELPVPLIRLLVERNGFIAYDGGLHVRGACLAPSWHSLRYWLRSDDALHRQFSAVRESDVPFAEDAFGDQYLTRDDEVHRLVAAQGEVQALSFGVKGFLAAVERDPVGFLGLEKLRKFRDEGGVLAPGELLSPDPSTMAAESSRGIGFRAIPAAERIAFLAKLARTVGESPD
jgi:hypothetical protein